MSLLNELVLPDERVLDPDYYTLLESHLLFLRTHPNTSYVEVTGQQAEKYTGDFHGLLNTLSVSKKYHYLVTRLNGMNASTDFDGKRTGFYVPSPGVVNEFISIFSSLEV